MEIMGIISSILTALSILVAIGVFWWGRQIEDFAKFRESLLYIQETFNRLENAITMSSLNEIGVSISEQIRLIYPDGCTKDNLIDLLSLPENQSYLEVAIDLGLRKSESKKEYLEVSRNLNQIPFKHQSQMPLISTVLRECLKYLTEATKLVASKYTYKNNFLDLQYRIDYVIPTISDIHDKDLAFKALAQFFPYNSMETRKTMEPVVDSSKKIISIIINKLLKKSDLELFLIRRKDKTLFQKEIPLDIDQSIDVAIFYLEKVQHLFKKQEWHAIIEAKDMILNITTPYSKQIDLEEY